MIDDLDPYGKAAFDLEYEAYMETAKEIKVKLKDSNEQLADSTARLKEKIFETNQRLDQLLFETELQ